MVHVYVYKRTRSIRGKEREKYRRRRGVCCWWLGSGRWMAEVEVRAGGLEGHLVSRVGGGEGRCPLRTLYVNDQKTKGSPSRRCHAPQEDLAVRPAQAWPPPTETERERKGVDASGIWPDQPSRVFRPSSNRPRVFLGACRGRRDERDKAIQARKGPPLNTNGLRSIEGQGKLDPSTPRTRLAGVAWLFSATVLRTRRAAVGDQVSKAGGRLLGRTATGGRWASADPGTNACCPVKAHS